MTRVAAMGLVAVATLAGVAHAASLTLAEALARAGQANPDLAAATAAVGAARGRLAQVSVLGPNPVVTAGATHHRIAGTVDVDNVDNNVSLGQELQIGGQRGLRIAAARFDVAHAEALRADRQRLVDGEVRRAFAGLVAAERRRALAVEIAAQAHRLADAAAARLAHGDVGRVDADLARLDALKTETDATAAATDVVRATARLAAAIGAPADETFTLSAPDEPPPATPAEPAAVLRALDVRPDLVAARAERDRLEGEADATHRTGIVPNPTVRGFYSHENGDETLVGGEIEVPLPVFDRLQGTETDLRGQAAAAAAQVVALMRQIPREVAQALVHHRAAAATWRRYADDAVPTALAARASLDRALAGGLMGLADVLLQVDRVRDTRRAAVDAWLDLREAEAEVVEAVGEAPW